MKRHVALGVAAFALVSSSAAAAAGAQPQGRASDPSFAAARLLRQGELLRFFVLPRVYSYRSGAAWVQSRGASVTNMAAARLRREGFQLAVSEKLRAWHGTGDIYPFKRGWYGASTLVEFGSSVAATAEVREMVRADRAAYPADAIESYRPYPAPPIPGARVYCVGHGCRLVYAFGRSVVILELGWTAGARVLTVGPPLLDRMRTAAELQFIRLRRTG